MLASPPKRARPESSVSRPSDVTNDGMAHRGHEVPDGVGPVPDALEPGVDQAWGGGVGKGGEGEGAGRASVKARVRCCVEQ